MLFERGCGYKYSGKMAGWRIGKMTMVMKKLHQKIIWISLQKSKLRKSW